MQGDLFRIHLNTFRRAFPHATLWYVYGSDQAFLMATPEPLSLDETRLQAKLDRLPAWFRAGEYQIDSVARVAGFFWLDEEAMQRMIGDEVRINQDDVHFFDKQSAVWPSPPQRRLPAYQASILPCIQDPDAGLRTSVINEQMVARLLGRYGFFKNKEDLFNAFCMMPENGNVGTSWIASSQANARQEEFCRRREIASIAPRSPSSQTARSP
jgi:spermidine synthase